MATWFNYYSFDVMGDLSFGKPFNMLIDGKDTYFSQQLHEDMKALGLFSHLTWLFPFFKRVPFVNSAYLKFWTWVDEQIKVFREGWAYGVGTDWAGLLVSRLNNNTRLEKYMQENIFKSLGLEFTSFCLEKHPEIKDNLVGISTRQPDGILVPSPNLWPFNAPDDCSEADLYSTVDDFTKTIGHLVRDSPVLLKKESVQQMFMGQLHEGSSALNVFRGTPDVSRLIGVNDIEKGANAALGGMYLEEQTVKMKPGILCWAGLPNLYWFANRNEGLAGFYASQVLPSADPASAKLLFAFIQ
jgi:CubicO group peptidase (beta-lactamase class C family)